MGGIVREAKEGVMLAVHVVPRAARSEIVGIHGQAVRIRVHAAPVGGAANAALIAMVANTLDVPERQVQLVSGHTSRHKTLKIAGLSKEDIQRWLESLAAEG